MTAPVSAIIPTYNRASCLPAAIDSALAQGDNLLEVLVIDDGSTDGTGDLVRTRYAHDPRVRYTYQENRGVAAARNEGLRLACGNYIAFLDSDDVWLHGKLQLQLACLEAAPDAGMVWTDMDAVDLEGRSVHPRYLRFMYQAYRWFPCHQDLFSSERPLPGDRAAGRLYVGDIFGQMVLGNLVHTSTVLLRRERAAAVGGFREVFTKAGEDYDYFLRVCREGPVAFADAVTIQYRIGAPDAITRPELDLDIAQAYLFTATEAMKRDRSRIRLSEDLIADAFASAYAWAGRAALNSGRQNDSRRLYFASLKLRPFRWKTLKFLAVSLFPRRLSSAAVRAVRASRNVKSKFRPAALTVFWVAGALMAHEREVTGLIIS